MEQLETLKKNYNEKTEKNVEHLFSTAYYPYLEFIHQLADKYMELSLSMTAVELYKEVGMIEECIDTLISKSYKEKATEMITQFLE